MLIKTLVTAKQPCTKTSTNSQRLTTWNFNCLLFLCEWFDGIRVTRTRAKAQILCI